MSLTTAEMENEIATLKNELAVLREEFRHAVRIDRDDDGKITDSQVTATFISTGTLILMKDEMRKSSGMIGTDDEGPYLSFWGDNDRARLMLRVTDNAGELGIFDEDLKPAVRVFADEHRQGHVAVFSPGGIPRAIMKAMETGGGIAALNEKGAPLAVVHSQKGKGEVVIVDQKVKAKLFGTDEGGLFTVFDKEGARGASLVASTMGNGMLIHKPGEPENTDTQFIAAAAGTALLIGQNRVGDDKNAAVELHHIPGIGAQLAFRDPSSGKTILELDTSNEGGQISLSHPDGGTVQLDMADGGGRIQTTRSDSENKVLLYSAKAGPIAIASGEERRSVFLQVTDKGGHVATRKGERLQSYLGPTDNGESGALMLTNADNSNSVNLAAGKHGGQIILGGDDGVTQASLFATEEGGQLTLFSEIGIERSTLVAKQDNGGLHLRFGGITGLIAAASERGGIVTIHDKIGEIAETLPGHGWAEEEDDDDDEA